MKAYSILYSYAPPQTCITTQSCPTRHPRPTTQIQSIVCILIPTTPWQNLKRKDVSYNVQNTLKMCRHSRSPRIATSCTDFLQFHSKTPRIKSQHTNSTHLRFSLQYTDISLHTQTLLHAQKSHYNLTSSHKINTWPTIVQTNLMIYRLAPHYWDTYPIMHRHALPHKLTPQNNSSPNIKIPNSRHARLRTGIPHNTQNYTTRQICLVARRVVPQHKHKLPHTQTHP